MKSVVIIPARYKSSRFPGKPLVHLLGKPMILWVSELSAQAVGKENVYIATDDERISKVVTTAGFNSIMTSEQCLTGTDRLAEAANNIPADIYINVQGDEPMLSSEVIDQVAYNLVHSGMHVATLCEKIESKELDFDPNGVKVVYNSRGEALYFSRSPIPAFRNEHDIDLDVCFRHVGLYAYRVSFLKKYFQMETTLTLHDQLP